MPTVNIFYNNNAENIEPIISSSKIFIAETLSCGDIKLGPHEVSVRLIESNGNGMLSEVEIEVTAHAFGDRVKKQDELCLIIRDYFIRKLNTNSVMVWLLLPELGHSWDS
jgi:hypothetical protein